jgi:hypothetical protein
MVTATFLGVLAIALFYIGIRSGRHLYFGFGLLALLAAFLFKQTAAMFAAIPAVALLTNRQLSFRTRFIYAGLPPVVPVAVTGIIHFWFPEVDRYFLWVPRQYNVYPEAAIGFLFGLIATTPLYCFALAEWCLTTSDAKETDDRARWLIAAAIVTVPASCFSLAKVGGWDNSLFPALVALTAFALWRFPRYQSYLGNDSLATERRFAFSSALGLMMIATVLMPSNEFLRGHNPYSILRQHPDLLGPLVKLRRPEHPLVEQEYQPVIEYVRDLPGRVVCPKDPTIPMYANGYLGRQLQSELDAVPKDGGYAKVLPDYTLREIQDARFLVHVRPCASLVPARPDPFNSSNPKPGLRTATGSVPGLFDLPASPHARRLSASTRVRECNRVREDIRVHRGSNRSRFCARRHPLPLSHPAHASDALRLPAGPRSRRASPPGPRACRRVGRPASCHHGDEPASSGAGAARSVSASRAGDPRRASSGDRDAHPK